MVNLEEINHARRQSILPSKNQTQTLPSKNQTQTLLSTRRPELNDACISASAMLGSLPTAHCNLHRSRANSAV